MADISYVPTCEGRLHLAVVEHLYSRMVVVWSMDSTMTSWLVGDALELAVQRRLRGRNWWPTLIGAASTPAHYQLLLESHGITCSMSEVGQRWDHDLRGQFSPH